MSFATFNQPWLAELRSQKDRIIRSGALDRLKAMLAEQHAEKDPVLPIPLAFDRATFDALARAAQLILSAQGKLLRALARQASRAELLRRFDIPADMEAVIDWDELELGTHVICRFDVVPSNDGYYFCEINTDSTVGGPEISDFLQAFGEAVGWPLTRNMASPQVASVAMFRRVLQDRGLERIVLCDWSANRTSGHLGFDLLRQHLVRALPELDIRLLDETEYPEAWLAPDEGRRTLVHRGFMYQDMTDGGAFMRRLCESGATVINKFETELQMHKGWLAILCDASHHHLLTPDERAAIATYVPFTTLITPDNLDDLLGRKADLVFKLGIGYGGDGVWMGADHSAAHLRALIEDRGLSRWIAQQVVKFDGIEIPFNAAFDFIPHNVVLGLYLIGGEASGLMVRASSTSKVVNVTNGAGGYTWAIPMTPEERAQHITAMRSTQP